MADVWLVPYLPLSEETDVEPWRLVPFRDLARRHARSREVLNETPRLRTAYKLRETADMPFGAVVLPVGGRIGDDIDRSLLRPLNRALVTAVVDGNPSRLGDPDVNAGHATMTAENAAVFGHPLHGGNSYAISTGAMVERRSLNHAPPGGRLPRIAPPHELPTPLFANLDAEYAAAVYDVLTRDRQAARRLDRCIEWLALAWSNTATVNEDARVIVFRAGFEALLGGGANTPRNRELLSALLDEPDAPRTPRSWPRGPTPPVELTALEWWFQSYAHLRNKVAHGDVIEDDDWLFDDGKRHLWHADIVLRRAIKRSVIRFGHDPRLEMSQSERFFARAYERLLSRGDDGDVEGP